MADRFVRARARRSRFNGSGGRFGVLLVNTGTPEEPTRKAVKRYLGAFLMDPRIRPMNPLVWWFILRFRILPKRSAASAEKYRLIWTDEGSPLDVAHRKLAEGLSAHYRERGVDVEVAYAMNYSAPSVVDGIRALMAHDVDEIVVLPMYPQTAFSTTGAVSDAVEKAVRRARFHGGLSIVEGYHDNGAYVKAIAASVRHAGFDVDSDDRLFFSYHSIPLSDIEAGDGYELQTGATSLAVANELGIERRRWTVGYQCRFDKDRSWLAPFTRSTLESWARSGSDARVFLVCPNFAVDCLETLYDVERELKPAYLSERAKASGLANGHPALAGSFVYVPCLNKSKAHLKVLVSVLAPYVHDLEGEGDLR